MKIFITGITGFLGGTIAEYCNKAGHDITALVRNTEINQTHFPFPVKICYGDIAQLNTLSGYLHNIDIVVHCAADTNMISIPNKRQEEVNITGIRNLITASQQANIQRFIHISSANTIRPGTLEYPTNESSGLTVSKKQLPYINSKIIGEELLREAFRSHHFPVIILNPTFILGPYDQGQSSGKLILGILQKRMPLFPAGGKNIVDARDIAQCVVNTFTRGELGNNYILSNTNHTYRELFALTCQYANIAAPKYQMPNMLGTTIGAIGYCYEYITKKSFSLNLKTMRLSTENHYYNSDKAKNELAFSPRSAYETIKDTVNWYQHECTHLQNRS
jgi:dihydroflavonol-4-reductase